MLPSVIETHKEAKELLDTAVKEGLITDPSDLYHFNVNLLDADIRTDQVRAEVYRIRSWRQDAAKWWSGLSADMYILRRDLNAMRIKLAERSSQERKRLASQGLTQGFSILLDHKDEARSQAPMPLTSHDASPLSAGPRREACFLSLALAEEHGSAALAPPLPCQGECGKGKSQRSHYTEERPPNGTGKFARASPEKHWSTTPKSPPTHHLISNDALPVRDLLSRTLSRPPNSANEPNLPASRLARKCGRQYRGSAIDSLKANAQGVASLNRGARPSGCRSLARLVKRVYGVRLDSRDAAFSAGAEMALGLDPESLTPSYKYTDENDPESDADEWEECL